MLTISLLQFRVILVINSNLSVLRSLWVHTKSVIAYAVDMISKLEQEYNDIHKV